MSPLEQSNPSTLDPEKYNIAEIQDKDFKIAIKNMLEILKDSINKSITEIYCCENTNSIMK